MERWRVRRSKPKATCPMKKDKKKPVDLESTGFVRGLEKVSN
jgi:hypothetical protein